MVNPCVTVAISAACAVSAVTAPILRVRVGSEPAALPGRCRISDGAVIFRWQGCSPATCPHLSPTGVSRPHRFTRVRGMLWSRVTSAGLCCFTPLRSPLATLSPLPFALNSARLACESHFQITPILSHLSHSVTQTVARRYTSDSFGPVSDWSSFRFLARLCLAILRACTILVALCAMWHVWCRYDLAWLVGWFALEVPDDTDRSSARGRVPGASR